MADTRTTQRTTDELAGCLRAWRDRLTPEAVGLPAGGARRAPGLRREEVASLAGLSVDYLSRLEQGRATNPSPSVLGPLARALRLTDEERIHLFRVAGQADTSCGCIDRHLTPGVQRMLDRLTDVPVLVRDAAWSIVAQNALSVALMGDMRGEGRDGNVAWRHFHHEAPSRAVLTHEDVARWESGIVADLRGALGTFPNDAFLHALWRDLLATSPRFAKLAEQRCVGSHRESRKTIDHPQVGRITVDCDVLEVRDGHLQMVINTVQPGTPDATALALLGAVGTQTFA
jgi:transcriptional regulator with XRE-family HTH domain